MVVSTKMIAVSGSNRPPLAGAKLLRKTDPKQLIKVSIYIRRNPNTSSEATSTIATLNAQPPQSRRYIAQDRTRLRCSAPIRRRSRPSKTGRSRASSR